MKKWSLARIGRGVRKAASRAFFGYGNPIDTAVWEAMYAGGHWDHLEKASELARFAVIAAYARQWRSPATVLDVGCGTGILRGHFADDTITRYYGVDISSEAIGRATGRNHPRSEFVAESMEGYRPPEACDVIILNESIGYAIKPLKLFQQFLGQLQPDGAMIVSQYQDSPGRRLMATLARHHRPVHSTLLCNEKSQRWVVAVYGKHAAS